VKVARYEVPGSHEKRFRPVGNGMIRSTGSSSTLAVNKSAGGTCLLLRLRSTTKVLAPFEDEDDDENEDEGSRDYFLAVASSATGFSSTTG
jgi:hypothetical protein